VDRRKEVAKTPQSFFSRSAFLLASCGALANGGDARAVPSGRAIAFFRDSPPGALTERRLVPLGGGQWFDARRRSAGEQRSWRCHARGARTADT
jgi:hypothetical protein